jgi:hypothetical protein
MVMGGMVQELGFIPPRLLQIILRLMGVIKMKNILRLVFCVSILLQGSVSAQIPSHVPGWPHISDGGGWALYTLPLMSYEGNEQFLHYSTAEGALDKFRMDGSDSPGWPAIMNSLIFTYRFTMADFDHDGKDEMLVNGAYREGGYYQYSLIYLIDDDGSVMNGFPVQVQRPSFLNVADVDGDNEYEILYYSFDEQLVNCLDRYGHPKPGWPVPYPLSGPYATCSLGGAIGDLDLDGFNEYIISANSEIFAFRYDGSMQPGFPIILPDTSFEFHNNMTAPSLGDLDGDGYPEIITSGNNWAPIDPQYITWFVAVYDHNGVPKPGWPLYMYGQYLHNSPVPSDIDGDGTLELGLAFRNRLIFVDVQGDTLPGFPAYEAMTEHCWSDLIIVDVNGDGNCEIFADYNTLHADSLGQDSVWYYGYGLLYATDNLGQDLPDYPIRTRGEFIARPPIFALDQATHRLYMAVADAMIPILDTVSVELFQFPDSTGPTTEWPMFGHDNLQTRNYNFVDRVTSINDGTEPILPKNYILKQNYPNPFNGQTTIEFVLPKSTHVTLALYDILGRKIADLMDATRPAGTCKYNLNMEVPSGVYFYTLTAENTRITRKMMLIK